ncbi:MAG: CapA family protein [Clostridiales bacterium]|nr:CapA family protein [Clostridiales bacterium]
MRSAGRTTVLLALLTAATLLIAMFTACSGKDDIETYGTSSTPSSQQPESLAPSAVATSTPTPTPSPSPSPTPTMPPQHIKVSFIGDCTLSDALAWSGSPGSFDAVYNAEGFEYFFKNAKEYLSQDDLTLANFEGTITSSTSHLTKEFVFGSPIEYMQIVKDGSIEAVNLANNHTYDYLDQGVTDTKAAMDENGILWSDRNTYSIATINGIKIGMCGIDNVSNNDTADQAYPMIDAMREEGVNVIIVSCHWGIEKDYSPRSEQVQIAHDLIDYGADIVVGTHPHRLQPIEKYNGKFIFYSLSNFCFGGNTGLSDPDSCIVQCEIVMDPTNTYATDYIVNIIPFSQTTKRPGNDYCPIAYEPGSEDYYRVMERLQWSGEDE